MRQAIMTAPGKIEFRDVPPPIRGPDDVLLRVRRIGVCGSDIHVYHGCHWYKGYPMIQGHEFSAVVEAAGEHVARIKPGAKVTAVPQVVCGQCLPCRRGDYHICDNLKVQGFHAPGCAQELFVTRAEKIVPLPDTFTFEQGALVEPTAVAVHAVGRGGRVADRNAVVLGAGPIGNLVAQVARARGARILITDLNDYRLEIAQRCGLQSTSNARDESLKDASRRVFGDDGFDLAFECVGVEPTMTAGVASIAKGGTIVVVGVFPEKPRIDLAMIGDHELSLIGTLMYKYEDYQRAVELISSGQVITGPLESKHFPFRDYLSAYTYIERQKGESMKVFIDL